MSDRRARIKVPVAEVAVGAYRAVFGHLDLLLELGWLPFLVLLPLRLAPLLAAQYLPSGDRRAAFEIAAAIVAQAATLLCLTIFSVRWHQVLLFITPFAPSRRIIIQAWVRFMAYTLLFCVLVMPPFAAVVIADLGAATVGSDVDLAPLGAVGGALLLLALFVAARLSLLYPAAAFGEPLGLKAAWQRMRGNSWRIIAALFLTLLPVTAAEAAFFRSSLGPVSSVAAEVALPLQQLVPPIVLGLALDFLAVALGASILSAFYQRLVLLRGGRIG